MHHPTLVAALVAAFAAAPAVEAGMYPKSSAVLQLDAKNFDSHITKSNYTSVCTPFFHSDPNYYEPCWSRMPITSLTCLS